MPITADDSAAWIEMETAEFAALRHRIQAYCGLAFGDSKRNLLATRLRPRLGVLGLSSFSEYETHLRQHDGEGAELDTMIDLVTTNKTSFFRESHHFEHLRRQVLPQLAAEGRRNVRIWSAGCSSGEEAWSLAMTLADFQASHAGFEGHIIASDIDRSMLVQAREASYPESDLEIQAQPGWRHHFQPNTNTHPITVRASPALRRLVEFRRLNLVEPTPRLRPGLDVIFCRNLLIYFDRKTRTRVITRLAELLRPGGYLFLGHAETMPLQDDTFENLPDNTWRKRLADANTSDRSQDAAPSMPQGNIITTPAFHDRWPGEHGLRRGQVIVGEVHADSQPSIVRTLLGSCVAICLWDLEARVGGVNHFMLPGGEDGGRAPRRFGERAMELLFERVALLGARRSRLQAKVFGGSKILMSDRHGHGVAEANVRYAMDYLSKHRISVVAQRTGGRKPLEVYFQTHDGRAWVRALHRRH